MDKIINILDNGSKTKTIVDYFINQSGIVFNILEQIEKSITRRDSDGIVKSITRYLILLLFAEYLQSDRSVTFNAWYKSRKDIGAILFEINTPQFTLDRRGVEYVYIQK